MNAKIIIINKENLIKMNLTFSSNNVKIVSKHTDTVQYMYNFPDNDKDHLISIFPMVGDSRILQAIIATFNSWK